MGLRHRGDGVGQRRTPAGTVGRLRQCLFSPSLEYDCIHEPAVVHPMATLICALFAWSERESQRGQPIDGRRFLTAMSVGVDIAGLLGAATNSGLRFFRPATAGGFGAAAGLASLAGLEEPGVKDVLGLQ